MTLINQKKEEVTSIKPTSFTLEVQDPYIGTRTFHTNYIRIFPSLNMSVCVCIPQQGLLRTH